MRLTTFVVVLSLSIFGCKKEEAAPAKETAAKPTVDTTKAPDTKAPPPDKGVAAPEVKAPDTKPPAAEPGAMPVDFPRQEKLEVAKGQLALGLDPYRLEDARKGQLFGASYTNFEIVEAGAFESKVHRVSDHTLPNAFVIPFRQGETVAKGDVVFTWWQTGGGQQYALVTGGSPTEPMVKYLTLSDNLDDAKKEHKLAPNSFNKLGAEWELGSAVAYKDAGGHKWGTLVNVAGDKLLVLEGDNTLRVVAKADAAWIPLKTDFKKGDKVFAPWMASFGAATVQKVDAAAGKVHVKLDFGSKGDEVVPFGRVATAVP